METSTTNQLPFLDTNIKIKGDQFFKELKVKAIGGGPNFFFLKINNCFYMKANCIYYKLLFTELINNH